MSAEDESAPQASLFQGGDVSCVHTSKVTVQVPATTVDFSAIDSPKPDRRVNAVRGQWLLDVEETTATTREAAALRHEQRAAAAHRQGRMMARQWHATRARAHRTRFQRLAQCGTGAVVTKCRDCAAEVGAVVSHCRAPTLCTSCRIDYQGRYRARSEVAMRRALELAKRTGRTYRGYAPRLLTVTVGHDDGGPAVDAETLAKAWPVFMRRLVAHLEKDRGVEAKIARPIYVRRMEATPSDGGHMHYHCWIVMPFVAQAILAHLWGWALADAGCRAVRLVPLVDVLDATKDPLARAQVEAVAVTRRGIHGRPLLMLYRPIVDVRKTRGTEQDARELCKYLLKDIDDEGQLLAPQTFANIYAAFMGRRTISGSRNLFAEEVEPPECSCPECGSLWTTRRYDHDRTHGLGERAPPKTSAKKSVGTFVQVEYNRSTPHVAADYQDD